MSIPFWNMLTHRERKVVLWVLGVIGFYAMVGFLILPPIVRSIAVKQISQQLGREVSIENVKINPFALSTTIDGLMIKDKDGKAFVSWDEVYVNFQISSFFGKAWVFDEISTTRPYVRAELNKDGTFNFSDIVEKFSTNAAPAKTKTASQPLVVYVRRLQILGARAAVADFTPHEAFKRTLGPLNITLDNFSTDPDNKNPYAFTGTTDAGERISWSGYFYFEPLRSEGELKLFDFTLNKYAALYQDLVRFEIRGGKVALDTKYKFELSATNRVAAIEDMAMALRDFKVGAPGDSNNLVELPVFAVVGASGDLQSRTANVDMVRAEGAKLFLSRDKNESVNVVELAKPAETATNVPGGILFLLRSVTNAVAMLMQSTNQWSGTVRSVDVTNCAVHLEDNINSRPAKLDLTGISLQAKNLSNLAGQNLTADLSMNWNTNGTIRAVTEASFSPPTADVHLDLDQLDLGTLDPYLEPKMDLYILGSKVGLHGQISLRTPTNDLPQVTFRGDANLDDFHTVDGVRAEDLVKWDSVQFNGMEANLNPQTVVIREIDVNSAYARLVIESNKTINLLNALRMSSMPATNAMETNVQVAAREDARPTANTNSTLSLPQISIGAIVFSNTAASFTDRSVSPEVNLAVQDLEGYISGLSTDPTRSADVNLQAKMDGAGPVTITGTLAPLNPAATNEVKISVKDMDLTPTGPYAGKFAGYGIAEGKLNLDLDYKLVGKDLSSQNNIMLDRFSFGGKVDSPDATKLPVRLAIAILKDRDGKIVLKVPVDGRIDDPKFHIGGVVAGALENVLVKVATSPFSLVGAAFGGGGEELGYQEFTVGRAELTAGEEKKLDTIVKALYERPALNLEIAGSVDPDGDREGLQRVALDRQIRMRLWTKLRKSQQATNSVDSIALTPEIRAHWIGKFYNEALADKKITPELIAANTNLAAFAAQILPKNLVKGSAGLMRLSAVEKDAAEKSYQTKLDPRPDATEAILLATFPVGEGDYEALAAARAKVVQDYLLQSGKVDAGRLFLTTAALRRDGSRAYLQFR